MTSPELKMKVYPTVDDLPPHLRKYVEDVPNTNLQVFRHPLWVDIMPVATIDGIENAIELKRAKSLEYLANGDLSGYIHLYERPFRMDALEDLLDSGIFETEPEKYWKLARITWIDSEQDESDARWDRLLSAPLPKRSSMTYPGEWDELNSMPNRITIFRGVHASTKAQALKNSLVGWSWTLSEETAHFFARRLRGKNNGYIASTVVDRSNVIAYFKSRGEEEIVIDAMHIDAKTVNISPI